MPNPNREAKNISYEDFLTSHDEKYEGVVSHKSKIPEFQRNYVWKKSQVDELISAIYTNGVGYYLGNIVIVKDSDGDGIGKIVDGQQRLITLSLVLFVLLDYITTEDSKELIKDMIWADRGNTVPRIKFTKESLNDVYVKILNRDTLDEVDLNKAQEVLYKSYRDIRSIIGNISNKEMFLRKILGLEFVVIRTYTENEAYLLFEGLNSTGLSLSAVELTKNAILGRIKELDPSKLDDALQSWNDTEQWFENINLNWFLKMLRHQWFSLEGYVTNPNLFKKIKEEKIQGASLTDIQDYLHALEKDAEKYLKLRDTQHLNKSDFYISMNGVAWDKIYKILFETTKLKLDQVYSVYLALWKYGEEQHQGYIQDGRKFVEHMELLWAFIFLIKFSDVSPSKYEKVFADLCHNIQGLSYAAFENKMGYFFGEELLPIVSGIARDEFAKRVSEEISTNSYDESFVKFLLNEYLTSSWYGTDTDLTLEHIIPKNSHVNWPNINSTLNLKYIENIGNLTILNEVLNKLAEDLSFDDKIEVAYNKSAFEKNKKLAEEYRDQFKSVNPIENAVLERGKDIGGVLYDKYLEQLRSA